MLRANTGCHPELFSGPSVIREKCTKLNKIFNFSNEVNELMRHQGHERGVKPSGKVWRMIFKCLLGFVLACSILLISVLSWCASIVWRSKPDYDGLLRNPQLQAEVTILRDQWGVPHIQASHLNDAWFALGFTVAQDRLPQLVWFKLLGQGRLSEVFGLWEPVKKIDLLMRGFQLHQVGQRMLDLASPEAKQAFRAYYAGVNLFLERQSVLPLELELLQLSGYEIEPFADDDLVGMVGVMALQLHLAMREDLLAEKLARQVGEEKLRELFPNYHGGSPAVLSSPLQIGRHFSLPKDEITELLSWLEPFMGMGHSNNWVIAPKRTVTQAALLAHDPHLGLAIPNFFYEAHVQTPEMEIAGSMVPGLPFLVSGHNTKIAWGMTSLHADAGDYYSEKLSPDGKLVQINGEWQPLTTREERLKGRWSEQTFLLRETPHGPIINDFFRPNELEDFQNEILSFRWTLLVDKASSEIEGFFKLNQASNWNEFRLALSYFGGLQQNFVYADKQGNIGLHPAASLPIRQQTGQRILPGHDGSAEWLGLRRTLELPFSYNPAKGWVGSANNALEETGMGTVAGYFAPGERMRRMEQLLQGSGFLSTQAMQRFQNDTCYPLAKLIKEAWGRLDSVEPIQEVPVSSLLKNWDGCFAAESVAASLVAQWEWELHEILFKDELGAELSQDYRGYASQALVRQILNGLAQTWVDDISTSNKETLNEVVLSAMEQAITKLSASHGNDWQTWEWGTIQTLQIKHPFGWLPGLDRWFSVGPFPAPGYRSTLRRASSNPPDWNVKHGASIRQVIDFSDLNRSSSVLPTGQSMHPLSPFFANQAPLYANGDSHPLLIDPREIQANQRHQWRLLPP